MSWYYNYYLGYKKDGKIYPLGVYDNEGKIHSVLDKSRSFASDLWEMFCPLDDEEASEELKNAFSWYFNPENQPYRQYIQALPLSELPKDDYFNRGYFLMKDVEAYLRTHDAEDLFYDKLSPEIYAARLLAEAAEGKAAIRAARGDGDEDEVEGRAEHLATDYMYFSYPDYDSREYESFIIKTFASAYEHKSIYDGLEIMVILTQG